MMAGAAASMAESGARRLPMSWAQALHALSTRITSLYWFNLSLKSLLKFPDTWEAMTRVGREIRMLEPLFLEGDAYRFERRLREGMPDWDLASIAAPDAAVLFALDTAYEASKKDSLFTFGAPRPRLVSFRVAQSFACSARCVPRRCGWH